MYILNFIESLYKFINNQQLFCARKKHPSVKKQESYLKYLEKSEDHYVNSYNKYKCVCFYHYNLFTRFLYNFISMFLLLPLYIHYSKNIEQFTEYEDRILLIKTGNIGIDDIIPDYLRNNYKIRRFDFEKRKAYLDNESKTILRNAYIKHPISFYYVLILMIRLSIQCRLIHEYNPEIICNYVCEREFSDPLITLYSEQNGVQYQGFMHGDYTYSIAHAFMQYSLYWVWDDYYIKMFKKLKCSGMMRVYTPGKYKALVSPRKIEDDYEYYATYYFSGEVKKSIELLKIIFDALKKCGRICKLRPHPRFSNIKYINTVFKNYEIEDLSTWDLRSSLDCSFLSIAINSTVLSQAYYSGKVVVIDDITNVSQYNKLKESGYIVFNRPHLLLSEILKLNGIPISKILNA